MPKVAFIMGDQLSLNLSSLAAINPESDLVFMCEVQEEAIHIRHHKKKLVLIFSAMRHFAQELEQSGYKVIYKKLTDNFISFSQALLEFNSKYSPEQILITAPSEYRVLKDLKKLKLPIRILEDARFLSQSQDFNAWAGSRKQLRMEYFYRNMRRRYNVLMDADKPVGGKWNYDASNRKPPRKGMQIPTPTKFEVSPITQEVIKLVAERFAEHFGDIQPFTYAVTRKQALIVLQEFINTRLANFGDYQDAMLEGEPWMYHAHISFYLNIGLLQPMECVKLAESAYLSGLVSLNAAEGFIRQILGWREYVRGIYWLKMPEYEHMNFLNACRDLPDFYWTANTKMNCLQQSIRETKENAYAHHIQRLMVLGNFALMFGVKPEQLNNWFWVVYADAFQWVELPNVSGMVLFADAGFLASKPYAAGGGYINKMSNYCKNCSFKVTEKTGDDACPFNYLYWDFLARNRDKLGNNQRLAMIYRVYDKMQPGVQTMISESAQNFFRQYEKS